MSAEQQIGLLAAAVFAVAGMVKGVTGMGLPTVAMALLGALISPVAAAGMLLLPSLITNLMQLRGGGLWPLLRRLTPLNVGIVVGTLATSGWLATGSHGATTITLGTALSLYALWSLSGAHFTPPARGEAPLSLLVGLCTGLLSGATGVFVIPAVPWLQALLSSRDSLIQGLGIAFTTSTLALSAGLWWHGALNTGDLPLSLLALAAALAGMAFGEWLRRRISPLLFRRLFLLTLLGLGAQMVWRAL